jgi:hypothetical protein
VFGNKVSSKTNGPKRDEKKDSFGYYTARNIVNYALEIYS